MTYLMTLNGISGAVTGCQVPDAIDDRQAGLKGNTARQIVRNVPKGVSVQQVARSLDLRAMQRARAGNFDAEYVIDFAALPADDGQRFETAVRS